MATAEFDYIPSKARLRVRRRATGLCLPVLLLALAACQSLGVGEAPPADASMGLLIAQDNCGRCHQIGGAGASPNANAPTFGEIANRPGTTTESLAAWLHDAHNYPVEMGFHLEPHQIDSLALYVMRWRSSAAPPTT
jgi:mono/diheme cytochrome c family protein